MGLFSRDAAILGCEDKSWPFQIITDKAQDFRNLPGRDLLSGFNYSFDNERDVFAIRHTGAFKPRFGFLPGQAFWEVARG